MTIAVVDEIQKVKETDIGIFGSLQKEMSEAICNIRMTRIYASQTELKDCSGTEMDVSHDSSARERTKAVGDGQEIYSLIYVRPI